MSNERKPRPARHSNPAISDIIGYRARLPIDTRARAGIERLSSTLEKSKIYTEILKAMDHEFQLAARRRLEDLAYEYWFRDDHDNRTTSKDYIDDVVNIIPVLEKTLEWFEKIRPGTRLAINIKLAPRADGIGPVLDRYNPIVTGTKNLKKACEALASADPQNFSRVALKKSCRALWDEWETVTQQPFKHRRWTFANGKKQEDGYQPREFVEPDAHFVQLVMQAFDPKITASEVRSALTTIVNEKSVKT